MLSWSLLTARRESEIYCDGMTVDFCNPFFEILDLITRSFHDNLNVSVFFNVCWNFWERNFQFHKVTFMTSLKKALARPHSYLIGFELFTLLCIFSEIKDCFLHLILAFDCVGERKFSLRISLWLLMMTLFLSCNLHAYTKHKLYNLRGTTLKY